MKLAAFLLPVLLGIAGAYNLNAPVLPDPAKTPGDVLTSDPNVICKAGYSKTVRNVPQQVKEQVYRNYGIYSRQSGEYEIDHLISLELGGSNSIRNLWPQSYQTQPLNAHIKDQIENKLHELACGGKITFSEAQQAIAHNWQEAYVKYIGPLPQGAVPARHPNQPSIPTTHVPTLPSGAAPAEMPTMNLPILPDYPAGPENAAPSDTPPDQQPDTSTPAASVPDRAAPNADGSCPEAQPIKGSGSKIYHLPEGDPNYRVTHATACFATPEAAAAAGFRAPK